MLFLHICKHTKIYKHTQKESIESMQKSTFQNKCNKQNNYVQIYVIHDCNKNDHPFDFEVKSDTNLEIIFKDKRIT